MKKIKIYSLLSTVAKEIPPSGIREFFDLVYSMPDCISLGVGEPDFNTPWRISDRGIQALQNGQTHYTPNKGLLELREILSGYLNLHFKISYDPGTEILITMGVIQGLDLALRSIINPGDEVIIFEPCYVSYQANITMLHATPVKIPTYFEDHFKINLDLLKKKITPKTKAIILNYPSNPTGATLDKNLLQKIANLALKNNLIIIADEIYSSLTYENNHFSIASLPGLKERTIYLNGFSKSHAMTGWRLGYIGGPKFLIETMLKIHQYTALCASSLAQYAAIEAIRKGLPDVIKMKNEYYKRRNFLQQSLQEIGYPCLKPEGAFYLFPKISNFGLTSREFALKLLKQEKVAVVPGDVFGEAGQGYIRCSFATSIENLKEATKRIKKFTSSL